MIIKKLIKDNSRHCKNIKKKKNNKNFTLKPEKNRSFILHKLIDFKLLIINNFIIRRSLIF